MNESIKNAIKMIPIFPLLLAWLGYLGYNYYQFENSEESPKVQREKRIETIKAETAKLSQRLKAAEEFKKNLENKRAAIRGLISELDNMKATLTETIDIPGFIKLIITEAKKVGLSVVGIQPAQQKKEQFYIEQGFDLKFRGVYIQLLVFLERIAKTQKITRVNEFSFKPQGTSGNFVSLTGDLKVSVFKYSGSKADEIATKSLQEIQGGPATGAVSTEETPETAGSSKAKSTKPNPKAKKPPKPKAPPKGAFHWIPSLFIHEAFAADPVPGASPSPSMGQIPPPPPPAPVPAPGVSQSPIGQAPPPPLQPSGSSAPPQLPSGALSPPPPPPSDVFSSPLPSGPSGYLPPNEQLPPSTAPPVQEDLGNAEAQIDQALQLKDPFKKPENTKKFTKPITPLESYPVEEFKLVGVITGPGPMQAIVEAPSKKTFFVKKNDKIGIRDGRIIEITPNKVRVSEKSINVLGRQDSLVSEIVLPEEGELQFSQGTQGQDPQRSQNPYNPGGMPPQPNQ